MFNTVELVEKIYKSIANEETKDKNEYYEKYIRELRDVKISILKQIELMGYSGVAVNSDHYRKNDNKKETIEIIECACCHNPALFGSFCLGNVIKYLTRYEHKHNEELDRVKDLKKAQVYISFYVEHLKNNLSKFLRG